ncbi:MAG TPA: hypothetical protein VEC09_07825, partial [Actinomycetota bacterium]|nr:hypothetical protein [Actinomycetota bacterium]
MSTLAMVVTAIALVLAGCRVDVTIDVAMRDDGSGDLRITLAADGDVVREAGGLEEDLRFDDLLAAGWEVGAPAATEGGGLQVVLAHPFASPAELSALLASLNGADGPFKSVVFERIPGTSDLSFTVTGTGRVDAGLASFADAELIATVGATPYA